MRNKNYQSPLIEVTRLVQESNFCASNGTTQNYGTSSIWGVGDDNEED